MKKLVVCGDSYMASISHNINYSDNGSGKHFTELLADKLGWEVITFARGGCSNQTIRLQIDEAIKLNPNYVIVSSTSPDRYEFPINDMTRDNYYDKNSDNYYIDDDGLYNIHYTDFPDKSAEHQKFNKIKANMFSDTLNNIFNNTSSCQQFLNKNEIKILEKWFDRFYESNWKKQQDGWILADGIRRLQDNNINFSFICTSVNSKLFDFCKDRIIPYESELNPSKYKDGPVSYRFHTSLETQQILSEKWYNYLQSTNVILKNKKLI
jgi:hypothetical protein